MVNRGAGQARRALFGRAEGVRYGGGIEPDSGRRQRGRRRKRPSRLWRRSGSDKVARVASSPGASEAEVSVRRARDKPPCRTWAHARARSCADVGSSEVRTPG